jgi:hypothetical protein
VKKNIYDSTPFMIASVEAMQDSSTRSFAYYQELSMSVDSHSNYYNTGMDPSDGLGTIAGLADSEVEMGMHEEGFCTS